MKTLALVAIAVSLSGCSSTDYKATTRTDTKTGIVDATRELKANSFLVKRGLGKVVLGADSLEGASSDQMQAASDALALASAALKR